MDQFKQMVGKQIGPGGMKCTCCAPPPGKQRAALRRTARRVLKQIDEKKNRQ